MLDEVAHRLSCAPSALRIREAKFFTPLAPAQLAELRCEMGEQRCSFSIQYEAVPIARGVLETGEAVIGLEIAAGTPGSPDILRHWSASYYPVIGPDGEPIGVGAVVEETTEQWQAEQRERAARADAEGAVATLRKISEAHSRF